MQLHILFTSLPIKGGADPQAAVAGYLMALEGRPAWAVKEAVRKYLRGEVDGQSLDFCPKPPALAQCVAGLVSHARNEAFRAAARAAAASPAVPVIPAMTAEERAAKKARVDEIMRRFHAGLPVPQKRGSGLDDAFWERANNRGKYRQQAE